LLENTWPPYLPELFRFAFNLRNVPPPECIRVRTLNYLIIEVESDSPVLNSSSIRNEGDLLVVDIEDRL
jgi:hypothetical protein